MSDDQQAPDSVTGPPSADNDTLAAALTRHGIDLPASSVDLLDRYARAVWETNQSLNLTRHTTYEKFVTRDVIDSLQLAALLAEGEQVLDVGTGGGVPGVIMAILRPDLHVELCDSVTKKAMAVRQIVEGIEFPVPVHHARGEEVLATRKFDSVVMRAVAPLAKVLKSLKSHWQNVGRLLLIKGSAWVAERGEARHLGYLKKLELRRAAVYQTPGTGAENVILKVWPKENT